MDDVLKDSFQQNIEHCVGATRISERGLPLSVFFFDRTFGKYEEISYNDSVNNIA